jgi:nucleotide-binding universal stress UspA family protein
MKWIVGLDAGPEAHAAVEFLRAVRATGPAAGESVVAVHVLTEEHLRVELRLRHLDEVMAEARAAGEAALRSQAFEAPLEVVQSLDGATGIADAATRSSADAVVVARHAGRDGRGFVRLGRVARGLLEALPAAVVIVPHDLRAGDLGAGPVVVLTTLGANAVDAVRFARRFATRIGRKLLVVHAIPTMVDPTHAERLAAAGKELEAWVASNGIAADDLQVVEGSAVSRSLELARELKAPLLVTGAIREDGELPRYSSQLGDELAASAPVPVAVVPPGESQAD